MYFLLVACASRRVDVGPEALDGRLAAGDTLFAARSLAPVNLGQAEASWMGVLGDDPVNVAALARLSHLAWVRHLVDPENAQVHLETGQEFGWRCLLAYPGFGAAAQAAGYHISAEATEVLSADAASCLTWTAANGTQLVALRGPGAALEQEPLALLTARLQVVQPGGDEGMGWWVVGQLALAQGDTAAAREAFANAITAAPSYLFFQVAMNEAFPDVEGTYAIEEGGPYGAENAAVAKKNTEPAPR